MNGSLNVTKGALVRLIDGVLYPNPDDPGDPGNPWGPYGPIGPIASGPLREFSWVLLNPQPLPPKEAGPFPQPWRSAVVARTVIDQVVAQYRFAEVMGARERSERAIETIRSHISEFVDDYCGSGARRWPLPRPFPLGQDPAELDPVDLLVAGAQFHKAADSVADGPLKEDFSAAADRLLETGMRRLEGGARAEEATAH